jgi:hypothetical protein
MAAETKPVYLPARTWSLRYTPSCCVTAVNDDSSSRVQCVPQKKTRIIREARARKEARKLIEIGDTHLIFLM